MCLPEDRDHSKRPAAELAALLERELRVASVAPDLLESVLLRHWSRISVLAHAIHEREMARQRNITRSEAAGIQRQLPIAAWEF